MELTCIFELKESPTPTNYESSLYIWMFGVDLKIEIQFALTQFVVCQCICTGAPVRRLPRIALIALKHHQRNGWQ